MFDEAAADAAVAADAPVADAPTSLPALPVDPTGACALDNPSTRGTFGLAPNDMEAYAPMPPNRAAVFVIDPGGADLGEVAKRVTLQAWPSGPPLPIKTTIETESTRTVIWVDPTAPLANGWYVLRLADPPAPLTRGALWAYHPIGARGLESRFHTDAFPTLGNLRICNRGGGSMSFRAKFSQNVRWRRDVASIITISQAAAAPKCAFRDDPAAGDPARIVLECTAVSEDSPVTFAIGSGLHGLDGVDVAPRTYPFTLRALPRVGSGVVMFHADPP